MFAGENVGSDQYTLGSQSKNEDAFDLKRILDGCEQNDLYFESDDSYSHLDEIHSNQSHSNQAHSNQTHHSHTHSIKNQSSHSHAFLNSVAQAIPNSNDDHFNIMAYGSQDQFTQIAQAAEPCSFHSAIIKDPLVRSDSISPSKSIWTPLNDEISPVFLFNYSSYSSIDKAWFGSLILPFYSFKNYFN